MSRLLLTCVFAATATAAPVPRSLVPRSHVGEWAVEFENGVAESCSVARDGKARVVEPQRSSTGQVEAGAGGVVVMTFDDDRVERWTPKGERYAVEHWFPSANYPALSRRARGRQEEMTALESAVRIGAGRGEVSPAE